jgi:hypothetical protein|tara:strand:- start:522 stop:818 length:297 start_codon:yes stop_codon:yes gene_type:complete
MKKNIFILFIFLILNNCGLSGTTALLGPVYTGATTGSAYQATISYGGGKFLKKINERKNIKKIPQENISNQEPENKIIATLIVDKVVISEVLEPEPLP